MMFLNIVMELSARDEVFQGTISINPREADSFKGLDAREGLKTISHVLRDE